MLIGSTYRGSPARSFRNVVIMAAVVAGVFYFAAMMPAFSFYYTAASDSADFDAVSGMLMWPSEGLSDLLSAARERGIQATLVWDAHTARVNGPSGTVAGAPARAIESRTLPSLLSTYYSESLLRRRDRSASEGVIIDTVTARRVGARVGEVLSIEWETEGPGSRPPTRQPVIATVLPTAETHGVLVVMPVTAVPVATVQVFLSGVDPSSASPLSGLGGEGVSLASRTRAADDARSRLNAALPRNTRYALIWVSLCLYVGFMYWEQSDRMRDRRKRHAILISMGLSERRLCRMLLVEQLILGALTAAVGCVAGALLMSRASSLYLPPDTLIMVLAYILGVNLLLGVLFRVRFLRMTRRLPTARLLAEG